MNQSEFLYNSLKAWEKSHVQGAIAFGFVSYWLKNWRESFKPITKRSNRNLPVIFSVCPSKILHKYFFYILLGLTTVPRETGNNAYAKFFVFSWDRCKSQEKTKTMLMQNFGGTNKGYYGIFDTS